MVLGTGAFPHILGILNVTPDSFSDGGRFLSLEHSIERAEEMISQGASIIDVGGESTRPGAEPVDIETELRRVLPVVQRVSRFCRVSIDTQKEIVAREAVKAGATIVNDVSSSLGSVAAELNIGWIAMHKQGTSETMQVSPTYKNVVSEVRDVLVAKAAAATEQGVPEVWIDPGFGFGKSLKHNLALLANLDQLVSSGFPVAVGLSRKSMLGQMLAFSDGSDEPVAADQRLVGSLWSAALSVRKGAQMVRVHDVAETVACLKVLLS